MKFKAIILLFFIALNYQAQNLVPNGDFETHSTCPAAAGQINVATPWYEPCGGSADYYNACANPSLTGVPNNIAGGYQPAHSGSGYAGIYTLKQGAPDYRSYLQIPLSSALIPNKCYSLEFYVSSLNINPYGSNNIGCYISVTPVSGAPTAVLNFVPQIVQAGNPVMNDTVNWVKVSGMYRAAGGEQYITIGNFKSDANTTIAVNDTVSVYTAQDTTSYYYIDDVTLSVLKAADAGADGAICSGSSVQIGTANYPGVIYRWIPGNGLSSMSSGITTAQPFQTTTYYLTQITPCADSTVDSVTVQVCDTTAKRALLIPNIFTPNDDGVNDYFIITGGNLAALNCKLYNRWGTLVTELTKLNEVWDGRTTSGLPCSSGVYFYVLTSQSNDGSEVDKKGFVELIR